MISLGSRPDISGSLRPQPNKASFAPAAASPGHEARGQELGEIRILRGSSFDLEIWDTLGQLSDTTRIPRQRHVRCKPDVCP